MCKGTYVESVATFVFSLEAFFSYNVVDRRGMFKPLLGPTVLAPFDGSYFDALRGLAGLDAIASEKEEKSVIHSFTKEMSLTTVI